MKNKLHSSATENNSGSPSLEGSSKKLLSLMSMIENLKNLEGGQSPSISSPIKVKIIGDEEKLNINNLINFENRSKTKQINLKEDVGNEKITDSPEFNKKNIKNQKKLYTFDPENYNSFDKKGSEEKFNKQYQTYQVTNNVILLQ